MLCPFARHPVALLKGVEMSQGTYGAKVICLGACCLLIVSCSDWRTEHSSRNSETSVTSASTPSETELKRLLARPTVMVQVDSEDGRLKTDIRNYLIREFRETRGMTVVTSDPLFRIYVLAAKMEFRDVPAFAMGVVVTTKSPNCREVTVDHLLLSGSMKDLSKQCDRVVSNFKMGRVARVAGGE